MRSGSGRVSGLDLLRARFESACGTVSVTSTLARGEGVEATLRWGLASLVNPVCLEGVRLARAESVGLSFKRPTAFAIASHI